MNKTLVLIGLLALLPIAAPVTSAEPFPLPASGQTKSYKADRESSRGKGAVAVPDDGRLRAGAPLSYRDNGDGTITDLNTGLMWEKKCRDCGGLHDWDLKSYWSGDGEVETVWDWIEQVNEEGEKGFAGYSDWRVANVKELLSIVDYSRFDPAAPPAFHRKGCESACAELDVEACSCTSAELYWTSTTFTDFPAHALVVDMGYGLVDDRVKSSRQHVRAVRSADLPAHPKGKPAAE